MNVIYNSLDDATRNALALSPDDIIEKLSPRLTLYATNEDMITAFAEAIFSEYRTLINAGKDRVVMICPVGPVGQYPKLAALSRDHSVSLNRLTLVVMDEYLTDDGQWIDASDPLSFRGHIERNLLAHLEASDQPEVIVPNPNNPSATTQRIDELGGVDVTFAGVGITGHLAFNDPVSDITNAAYFADLPTRIVSLLPETRLINSVTASRGNVARIPRLAVTVGMREILGARKLRIFMNRHWQSAAIRRLAFGPVSAAFPASLVQDHPDWSLSVVEDVLNFPEPVLA